MTQLRITGIHSSRSDVGSSLRHPGDAALVKRGEPRLLVVRCPCGCGEEYAINLDRRAGQAWRLFESSKGFTLFPSVWRDVGCLSHYIIWNSVVYILGVDDEDADDPFTNQTASVTEDALLTAVSTTEFEEFSALADRVQQTPWDVLIVCRRLVRRGHLVEASGRKRGFFKRKR
jgi:hypothetical protein